MSLANYPSSMRMVLNRLSNFARVRTKTLVYSPSGTAKNNDIIRFEIPAGCIFDPNTLSIHGKISTDFSTATGSIDYVLPPKFSHSLIQELKVSFNGTQVFQCNDINQLYNAYMKYMGGDAERNRMTLFEFGRNWTAAPGVDTKLDKIPFFISGLIGSPLSTGKLINTSLTGPILIEWRVIPTQALIIAAGTTNTMTLEDLSLQYDVVVTDGFYEELQLRALESAPLELAFKNYMVTIGSSQTLNNANIRTSISTKSLDAIWVSMLPSDYSSAGNTFKTEIENANYFFHGDGKAGPVTVQIGNTMYPQYDLQDSSQVAAMTFSGMGILNDTLGSCAELVKGPVGSTGTVSRTTFLDKFNLGNYLAYFKLNACGINEIYGVQTLSGINTQGSSPFINITYKQDSAISGTSTIFPWCALEYTSVVRIGKYRQIELDP